MQALDVLLYGQPRAGFDVSAWRAEVLGQIGRQRPRQEAAPRRAPASEPRRMPAMTAAVGGGRRLMDDEGWPE